MKCRLFVIPSFQIRRFANSSWWEHEPVYNSRHLLQGLLCPEFVQRIHRIRYLFLLRPGNRFYPYNLVHRSYDYRPIEKELNNRTQYDWYRSSKALHRNPDWLTGIW